MQEAAAPQFQEKAFFEYHQGFKYVKNRYFLAKKILKVKKSFEKPINNQDLSVHVLTGHRDLVMLVWALASYYLVSQAIGQLYIHSDGTLDKGDKKIIKKFFPSAQVVEPAEFLEKFDSELMNYPLVKKYRTQYPQFFLLKKLLDPYFYSTKRLRLIIDSDLKTTFWEVPDPFNQDLEFARKVKNQIQKMVISLIKSYV